MSHKKEHHPEEPRKPVFDPSRPKSNPPQPKKLYPDEDGQDQDPDEEVNPSTGPKKSDDTGGSNPPGSPGGHP